jgi:hypothetical protein
VRLIPANTLAVLLAVGSILILGGGTTAQGAAASQTGGNSVDKYKEARDLIRRARTLLSEVVKDNPGMDDAYFARLQLAALQNIFKTDIPVVPVSLNKSIVWRVIRVQVRESDTKITVEIENTDAGRQQMLYDFNEYPLLVVADKKIYEMKKMRIKPPAGVQAISSPGDGSRVWQLQPTQAVVVDLYFDELDDGVVQGVVKYTDDHRADSPAAFSLLNVNQNPPQ